MKLNNWTSLATLQDEFHNKSLTVKPRRRSYLSQVDAVYDYIYTTTTTNRLRWHYEQANNCSWW